MDKELTQAIDTLDGVLIEKLIYNIRGQQVMLDSDIAYLFEVETRRLNEQMKRNISRFPDDFCFQLNSIEFKFLRSQNATFNYSTNGRKYIPYVYTEHGIMALAGVLKSEVAAKMSVEIVRTFIKMRKFIMENGDVLLALAKLQNRQLEFENNTNKKFEEVFNKISKLDLPKTALFFDGEWFDAYEFISSLIMRANESIVLIDRYCDSKALTFLKHKSNNVKVLIYKGRQSKLTSNELKLFEAQYGQIETKDCDDVHDRYLIIDSSECYSLGTSLNHAGKRLFTVSKIDDQDIIDLIISKTNSTSI